MTQMSMGGNIALTVPAVRAVLQWSAGDGVPDVDVSALLLDESGQVASDADFVFYNEPVHYSGSVRLAGKTPGAAGGLSSDVIDVALAAVPEAVQRIVLAGSADGGTFGQVPGLLLQLLDGTTGAQLAYFQPTATDETAYVTGEFYRRDGGWKFRAIGQGYSTGLAGLASDYGIDVGESDGDPAGVDLEPESVAPPAAPPMPPLPPLPPLPPPVPVAAPVAAPVTPAATSLDLEPPAAASLDLDAPAPAVPTPVPPAPPSLDLTPPAPAAAPAPVIPPPPIELPPPAVPAPEPAAPTPAPAPVGEVISLVKNQRVDLGDFAPSAAPLLQLVFTLGWLPIENVLAGTDLDASVIAFDAEGKKKAIVWYMHQDGFKAAPGAVKHHGDNRGAPGEPGLEQITVDLNRVPAEIHALVFTINSFRGHTFTDIAQSYVVVQNQDDGTQLVRYDLSDTQPSTALLTAMLRRTAEGGWDIKAIGEFYNFRTVKKLIPAAQRHVTLP
jgi:stress response protein SCP2